MEDFQEYSSIYEVKKLQHFFAWTAGCSAFSYCTAIISGEILVIL